MEVVKEYTSGSYYISGEVMLHLAEIRVQVKNQLDKRKWSNGYSFRIQAGIF